MIEVVGESGLTDLTHLANIMYNEGCFQEETNNSESKWYNKMTAISDNNFNEPSYKTNPFSTDEQDERQDTS